MTFEWDEEKRRANIRKHGFDSLMQSRCFRRNAGLP